MIKTYQKYLWFSVGFIVVYVGIVFINASLSRQMEGLVHWSSRSLHITKPEMSSKEGEARKEGGMNILRVERKDPQEDYAESVVIIGKNEVARFKNGKEEIFDVIGQIPDGAVKFVNEWENTYGHEYYRNGKREGVYLEYDSKGQLKVEAEYTQGYLLTRKSYYYNGALRMEEDYRESRFMFVRLHSGQVEYAGTGKIYRLDGSLKFAWCMVDHSNENYTKTYDSQGNVTAVQYYNIQGDPVEFQKTR